MKEMTWKSRLNRLFAHRFALPVLCWCAALVFWLVQGAVAFAGDSSAKAKGTLTETSIPIESWQLAEQLGVRPAYIQEMLDYYTQAQGVNFSWELKKRRRARETQEALEADPLTEATRLELSQYIDIENDITESAAQQMLSIIAAMKGKPKGGPQ